MAADITEGRGLQSVRVIRGGQFQFRRAVDDRLLIEPLCGANQLRLNEVRAGLIKAVLPVAGSTLALSALGFGLSIIDPSPEARPWQVASAVGVGFSLASIALGLHAASHLKTVQIAPFLPPGGAGLSVSATF